MIDINYLAVAVGIAAGISGVIFGYIKMRQVQESSSKERRQGERDFVLRHRGISSPALMT